MFDATDHCGVVVESAAEVVGMGAVDAEVEGAAVSGTVHLGDRLVKLLPRSEGPVGLDGERDDDGCASGDRGAHDADGLSVCVAVSMVTRSAPTAANDSICARWYAAATSAVRRSLGM